MTPLAFVVLFLLSPAEAGVGVRIDLPEESTAQSQSRLNASEILIRTILGPEHKKAQVSGKKGAKSLDYSAEHWSSSLPKEDLAKIIVTLKGLWSERISFTESHEAAGAGAGKVAAEVSRVKLPDGRSFTARPAETLKLGAFGGFYDGSLAAANLSLTPVEAYSFKRPGLTAETPDIVFTPVVKEKTAEPPSPALHRYEAIIAEEAKEAGLAPAVLRAVVDAKGGFEARENRRSGGAYGVMLITRNAASAVGMKDADLTDARANIRVGARLLAELLEQFRGDIHRALAAYQLGARAVIRSGGIPNDPEVKYFLAAYERALRDKDPKPAVKPVKAPSSPNLRRVREEAAEKIREKVEQILPPTGLVRPRDQIAKYRKTIHLKAKKHGVDPWLIEAIMRSENPWGDPMLVSHAGAIGLMQIMPGTAKMLRVDPRSPAQAIDGATRHLKYLLELYKGNQVLAVAAYNAGEGVVGERIPNYGETKGYVVKVFGYYEELTGVRVDPVPYMPVMARRKTNKSKA
ncbi:MAG: lytic transglycosylase domain-containing protein [Elusimicrobia bacterium]|nr:lytic transglycosylase domain-containing protein [Elusimicrobiota bacterium]